MKNPSAGSCRVDPELAPLTYRPDAPFDLGDIHAAAQRLTEGASLVRPGFVPAYRRLTTSLTEEADLTPTGVAVARRRLISALTNQIAIRALVQSDRLEPQLYGDDAVFVVGLPGTGLRHLQLLLNQHCGLNIPTLREILSPTTDWRPWSPNSSGDDPFERPLWAHLGRQEGLPAPELGAPYSDELLTTYAFHSQSAALEYRIPGYADWLRDQDTGRAFRFHRSALAVILERVRGGIPLLVNEFHSLDLGALLTEYPRARVIRVHRDPLASLADVAHLSARRRQVWSRSRVDPLDVRAEWTRRLTSVLAERKWSGAELPGHDVLDLTHLEVAATPLLTVRRICAFLRIPLPLGIERRILKECERLSGEPEGLRGRRVLDEGVLPADFRELRAAYCREWDL